MCADCGEPLICVSRTARACVSYLFRRKHAHDISVHSSVACRARAATRERDGAAGPAARAAPRDDARRTGRGARGPDGGANARQAASVANVDAKNAKLHGRALNGQGQSRALKLNARFILLIFGTFFGAEHDGAYFPGMRGSW